MSDSDLLKALRAELAESDGVRSELYALADAVADIARALAPEGEGVFRASIEARPVRYRKLSKRTRVARIMSTDDPRKVAALEYGRDADNENGASPAYRTFERTAAAFNTPVED